VWKVHLSWKVYILFKHARFGVESFELCEAKTTYVWNSVIYTGQDTPFDDTLKSEPYGSKVVLDLTGPLLNQRCHITMENWFSSPHLCDKLSIKQTNAMGTLHQKRKVFLLK
jgi:hypothetical protein